jgi:hypothetical protein
MKNKTFLFPVYGYTDAIYCPFRRFEVISNGLTKRTVVKIKKGPYGYAVTLSSVKWSKYRFVNLLKKLFIIIKYSI